MASGKGSKSSDTSSDHPSDEPAVHADESPAASVTTDEIFKAHDGGKLITASTFPLDSTRDLSIVYTPGVAQVCEAIHDDPQLPRTYTWTGNNVAVISGVGAAGVATTRMLLSAGVSDIVVDSRGIIHEGRVLLNEVKATIAALTNPRGLLGTITDALVDADAFIGVSAGHLTAEQVAKMADGPFLFSPANPNPEIPQDIALQYGSVVATGRSYYPNQINNVLAFPGIFKGALAAGAT